MSTSREKTYKKSSKFNFISKVNYEGIKMVYPPIGKIQDIWGHITYIEKVFRAPTEQPMHDIPINTKN